MFDCEVKPVCLRFCKNRGKKRIGGYANSSKRRNYSSNHFFLCCFSVISGCSALGSSLAGSFCLIASRAYLIISIIYYFACYCPQIPFLGIFLFYFLKECHRISALVCFGFSRYLKQESSGMIPVSIAEVI